MALNAEAITAITTSVKKVVEDALIANIDPPITDDATRQAVLTNLDKLATAIATLVGPLVKGIVDHAVVSVSTSNVTAGSSNASGSGTIG